MRIGGSQAQPTLGLRRSCVPLARFGARDLIQELAMPDYIGGAW